MAWRVVCGVLAVIVLIIALIVMANMGIGPFGR
jgi:hypothetical protein